MQMISLGETLKNARLSKGLIFRKVAAEVEIDQSLICKFEKNERKPTFKQLLKLAEFYDLSKEELIVNWHSEKIARELMFAESIPEILRTAEMKISFYKGQNNEE